MTQFLSLWAVNGALDANRLRSQIDDFAAAGLDGVVFHPRFFPDEPAYLSPNYMAILNDVILYARSRDLTFWIYDENGWPSGTAGGRVLAEHPEVRQLWLGLERAPSPSTITSFDHEGVTYFANVVEGHGVDYLRPDTAEHFLACTYDAYYNGLSREAFDHVEAFFDDEPELGLGHAFPELPPDGALPWSSDLPATFRERYGVDLLDRLVSIFFTDERSPESRVQFWELVNDLFADNYLAAIDRWCVDHGTLFTAHMKGEEHPLFQVPIIGSNHQNLQRLSLPGVDALERDPSGDFFPRQASSVARQFGAGRAMVEAFGGAGWGASPEDLERYLVWLGKNGVTDFALHLSQYRLDSQALLDWPPSLPRHVTWRAVFPEVLRRVRATLRTPRPTADTLVVVPQRAVMSALEPAELLDMNIHNGGTYRATEASRINDEFLALLADLDASGVVYDVADERTVEEHTRIDSHRFFVGAARYHELVVPPDAHLAIKELERFVIASPRSVQKAATSSTSTSRRRATVAPVWRLEPGQVNDYPLTPTSGGDGRFNCQVVARGTYEVEAVFADKIDALVVNGAAVSVTGSDEGSRAAIKLVNGNNKLCFEVLDPAQRVFAWLRGTFEVHAKLGYQPTPSGLLSTNNAFAIGPREVLAGTDLVVAGYPFAFSPVTATTSIVLDESASSVSFEARADAFGLTVDGSWMGWSWPVDGTVVFMCPIAAGSHKIALEAVPNGYNFYGPRNHYRGDIHTVSPEQILGAKNFADPLDAPNDTHDDLTRVRRFELPRSLRFL